MNYLKKYLQSLLPAIALLFALAGNTHAYEINTHEELTQEAAERWFAENTGVLKDAFNISDLATTVDGKTIIDWFRKGAAYEDCTGCITPGRYLNHFYNPIDGRGLHSFPFNGIPSPDWGLEDAGDINGQEYSYKDANQYYFEALTLPTKDARDEKLAKMFHALGDVLHLLQDAGQPQHTRNDSHGMGSLYEKLTGERMSQWQLPLDGYPIVKLPLSRDYFHSEAPGANNIFAGQGLAEFSNRNFISAGTNFTGDLASISPKDASVPFPDGSGVALTQADIKTLDPSTTLQGTVHFIGTPIPDSYDSGKSGDNTRTSTFSIFNSDLTNYNFGHLSRYTYNRFNAEASHEFLIPRAVGYSAGLIGHFFETKIEATNDYGVVTITNPNSYEISGTFRLYTDSSDTSVVREFYYEWPGQSIPAGGQIELEYTVTAPIKAKSGILVLEGIREGDTTNPAVAMAKINFGGFLRSEAEFEWLTWAPNQVNHEGSIYVYGSANIRTITYYREYGLTIKQTVLDLLSLSQDAYFGSNGSNNITITYEVVGKQENKVWYSSPVAQGPVATNSDISKATVSHCGAVGDAYFPLWLYGFPDTYEIPASYIVTIGSGDFFSCILSEEYLPVTLYSLE